MLAFRAMLDPIKMLRQRLKGQSLRALAREIGCSAGYLSDLLSEPPKRTPGPKIAQFLGLEYERESTFRRLNVNKYETRTKVRM